jgi:predicted Zn-dependent protease
VSYSIRAKADYATEGLYAIANHEFSEEPDIRLLIGSMAEANAGPFQPTAAFRCGQPSYFLGPDGCVLIMPAKSDTRVPKGEQEAVWAFRTALKMDPSLTEARMRLGRMLYLVGQMAEARNQLEQSLAEATDEKITFIAYLSALFLGELEEHEGHMTTAIARYREAVKLEPGAHTANVALGGALLRAGYKDAWIEARRMFDGEGLRSPAPLDPWVFYRYSQFYKVAADLRAMREALRPPLHARP